MPSSTFRVELRIVEVGGDGVEGRSIDQRVSLATIGAVERLLRNDIGLLQTIFDDARIPIIRLSRDVPEHGRVPAVRAIRELLGCDLPTAKQLLASAAGTPLARFSTWDCMHEAHQRLPEPLRSCSEMIEVPLSEAATVPEAVRRAP